MCNCLTWQASDSIEQGRWLNILIKETGYIGQGGAVEYNYIDEDGEHVNGVLDDLDLYDEVNVRQNRTAKGYDGRLPKALKFAPWSRL